MPAIRRHNCRHHVIKEPGKRGHSRLRCSVCSRRVRLREGDVLVLKSKLA